MQVKYVLGSIAKKIIWYVALIIMIFLVFEIVINDLISDSGSFC